MLGVLAFGICIVGFLGLREMLFPASFRTMIYKEASSKGFDPLLIAAIIVHETRFGAHKISPKGAIGLMQVMPKTLIELENQRYLSKGEVTTSELTDPQSNVLAGIEYLRLLERRIMSVPERYEKIKEWYQGDPTLVMLHSYNAGPTFILRKLLDTASSREEYESMLRSKSPVTLKYGQNIMSTYKKLQWINATYPYFEELASNLPMTSISGYTGA